MKKVDVIIVGQGLAGTCVAARLLQLGKEVMILDPFDGKGASHAAAGLFNPVTGRKMVKTWKANELFEGLADFYQSLESLFEAHFFHEMPIYRPFFSIEDQNDWVGADQDKMYADFIQAVLTRPIGIDGLQDVHGGLMLKNSGYVDLPLMISAARAYFMQRGKIIRATFDENLLIQEGRSWLYNDGLQPIAADWVIDCTGVSASKSKLWNGLRFKPVKGEWIDIDVDLKENLIVNRGVFMIPKTGFLRVGATYDHDVLDSEPSEKARNELKRRLEKILIGDYRILDQKAGVRPATFDRRPFVGVHGQLGGLAMLNGLGAKGVTLAPYFSKLLCEQLFLNRPMIKEVDVNR
ncbi:MAG: glycine oxidase [Cyclobacteriaceae bacterium]